MMVGPGGRKPYTEKSGRSAHFVGIYPVANCCRLSVSSKSVAIIYSLSPTGDRAWREQDTAATCSGAMAQRIGGSGCAPATSELRSRYARPTVERRRY